MNILIWLVLGALSGWIASMIIGTNKSQGLIGDIILGIVGAFLGGFLFNLTGYAGVTGLNIWSIFVAVVGASIALLIGRAVARNS